MRRVWVPIVVSLVLFVPTTGNAQAVRAPEPPPLVNAANVEWQMRGEPIFYASNFYWPSGPDVFFDGAVMVRTGEYEGIPLYVDPFLQAYSVVYLPVGNNVLRPYVRRDAIAGRIGSAGAPSPNLALRGAPVVIPQDAGTARPLLAPSELRPVGTAGVAVPRAVGGDDTVPVERSTRVSRTTIGTLTPPRGKNGIWLQFNGARYYSAGAAVTYSAARFVPIGSYRGVPVYRDLQGHPDEIFVPAVANGPLTPYRR
jgi:hypothetical protein